MLIFGDNITRTWKQIIHFNGGDASGSDAGESSRPSLLDGDDHDEPGLAISEHRLVRDERGVRLARETED